LNKNVLLIRILRLRWKKKNIASAVVDPKAPFHRIATPQRAGSASSETLLQPTMAAVRTKASSVESAEAHAPDQAARDDSSTTDHDEEKRDDEKEIIAGGSPVLGGAGVAGLPKEIVEGVASESRENPVEDEKFTGVQQSTESSATNENGDAKDMGASNGDSKGAEDGEADMVFPSGVPLALLTFGLCMAT